MEFRKIFGIIFIILGLFFVIYPVYSAEAVSIVVSLCLLSFGFALFVDGFSAWSIMTHVSLIKIVLGILAILLGILFIYSIDALAFMVAFQFYFIAIIMIIVGVLGVALEKKTSKIASAIILIMGIIAVFLAFYSITQPIYAAILVGICLIMDGICFFIE